MVKITQELLDGARTEAGGFRQLQISMARKLNPIENPVANLVGIEVPDEWWDLFTAFKAKKTQSQRRKARMDAGII
jgi:hypothetical protein